MTDHAHGDRGSERERHELQWHFDPDHPLRLDELVAITRGVADAGGDWLELLARLNDRRPSETSDEPGAAPDE